MRFETSSQPAAIYIYIYTAKTSAPPGRRIRAREERSNLSRESRVNNQTRAASAKCIRILWSSDCAASVRAFRFSPTASYIYIGANERNNSFVVRLYSIIIERPVAGAFVSFAAARFSLFFLYIERWRIGE